MATKKTPTKATPETNTPHAAVAAKGKSNDVAHMGPSHEQIAHRAYVLFEKSGFSHGKHVEHWLQAETELAGETGGTSRNTSS